MRRRIEVTEATFLSSMSSSKFSKGKNVAKNKKYATGPELDLLRNELNTFRETLQWAQAMEDKDRVVDLTASCDCTWGEARS
jgi:hypothetical protein